MKKIILCFIIFFSMARANTVECVTPQAVLVTSDQRAGTTKIILEWVDRSGKKGAYDIDHELVNYFLDRFVDTKNMLTIIVDDHKIIGSSVGCE